MTENNKRLPGELNRVGLLLREARIHNDKLDAVDRKRGAERPWEMSTRMQVSIAVSAITAGLNQIDTSMVAQGLDLLLRLEEQLMKGAA